MIYTECQAVLYKIYMTMGKYYSKRKKEVPDYKVNDLYILNTMNLSLGWPTKKFIMKIVSTFKIDKIVSSIVVCLILLES
jgi:hypothetical protein